MPCGATALHMVFAYGCLFFSVVDNCVYKQCLILVKVVCKICLLLKESFPCASIELSNKELVKTVGV